MRIFNTTKETLRHYENLGLIEPEFDSQNYRYYDHKEIRKLRQIFYLRDLEIPLDENGFMLISWSGKWAEESNRRAMSAGFVGQIWDSQAAIDGNLKKLGKIGIL